MAAINKMSIEEIENLRVSKIGGWWNHVVTIQMTLNDG